MDRRTLGRQDTGLTPARQRQEAAEKSARSLRFCRELARLLRARRDAAGGTAFQAELAEADALLEAWAQRLVAIADLRDADALTAIRGINAIEPMRRLRAVEAGLGAAAQATDVAARPSPASPPAAGRPPAGRTPTTPLQAAGALTGPLAGNRTGTGPLTGTSTGKSTGTGTGTGTGMLDRLKQIWRAAETLSPEAATTPGARLLAEKLAALSQGAAGTASAARRAGTGELAHSAPPPLVEAISLARRVVGYVGPRVGVFRDALTLLRAARPGDADPKRAAWAGAVCDVMRGNPAVQRQVTVVVTQFDAATTMLEEAETVALGYTLAPSQVDVVKLSGFDPRKLRGAVIPLGHLHVTFQHTPVVNNLFPPPPAPPG